MTEIRGWNTTGITGLGLLSDGRLKLEFTGADGEKRNIFMPADLIPLLVVKLIDFNAKVAATQGKGDLKPGDNVASVKHVAAGSNDDGTEFFLALTTLDDLQLRFLLTTRMTEGLALGLVSELSRHGKSLPPLHSEGSKH